LSYSDKRDMTPTPVAVLPNIRVYFLPHSVVKAGVKCDGAMTKEGGYYYDHPLKTAERRKAMREVQDILAYGYPWKNGENEVIFVPPHQILRVVLSGVDKE